MRDIRRPFSEWLYKAAERHGSICKVADMVGVNRMTLYRWESMPDTIPTRFYQRMLSAGEMTTHEVLNIIIGEEDR